MEKKNRLAIDNLHEFAVPSGKEFGGMKVIARIRTL